MSALFDHHILGPENLQRINLCREGICCIQIYKYIVYLFLPLGDFSKHNLRIFWITKTHTIPNLCIFCSIFFHLVDITKAIYLEVGKTAAIELSLGLSSNSVE